MQAVTQMDIVRKPLAVVLGGTAAVVLIHFVFGPFYRDALDGGSVWDVVNWFMAFSFIAALITTAAAKIAATRDDRDVKTYIQANVAFYATAALSIVFCWNWFNDLVGDGNGGDVTSLVWVVVDTVFPILIGSVSVNLWKGAPRA